jgi:hypothetical protein
MATQELDTELCCRSIVFLMRSHESAIVSTPALANEVAELQQVMRASLLQLRNLFGTNIAGLRHLGRAVVESRQGFKESEEVVLALKPVSKKKKRKFAVK